MSWRTNYFSRVEERSTRWPSRRWGNAEEIPSISDTERRQWNRSPDRRAQISRMLLLDWRRRGRRFRSCNPCGLALIWEGAQLLLHYSITSTKIRQLESQIFSPTESYEPDALPCHLLSSSSSSSDSYHTRCQSLSVKLETNLHIWRSCVSFAGALLSYLYCLYVQFPYLKILFEVFLLYVLQAFYIYWVCKKILSMILPLFNFLLYTFTLIAFDRRLPSKSISIYLIHTILLSFERQPNVVAVFTAETML